MNDDGHKVEAAATTREGHRMFGRRKNTHAAADERAAIAGWRDTGDEMLLGKAMAYADMRATLQALRREVTW